MLLDVRIDHARILTGDPAPGSNPAPGTPGTAHPPGGVSGGVSDSANGSNRQDESAMGSMRSIGIHGDRIVLGVNPATAAKRVIDATGKMVCPGFIDIHAHSDFAALHAPSASSKTLAGYTTELNGNCGFGAFPLYGQMKLQLMEEHARWGLKIDWETVEGYQRKAEQQPMALNQGLLIGHGTLRGSIVGLGEGAADRAQRQRMQREVERAMRMGCFGLSTGLVYAPGSFAGRDEIAELATVVAQHGGLYASHLRSESDGLLEALEEFAGICEQTRCRAQYSHIKTAGRRNWGKLSQVRRRMDEARSRGVELFGDRYPYTASCTALAVIVLPNDALAGTPAEIVARLKDRTQREALAQRVRQRERAEEDGGSVRLGWYDRVVIAATSADSVREARGKTLADWAKHVGVSDPLEAAIDLLIEDGATTTGIHFSMSDENMRTILNWPDVCIGSDSHVHEQVGERCEGASHPREFGTPGRILGQLCREAGWFDLPTAVHKLTGLPARIMRLSDRGLIREGYFADLVIFDPATIADRATYEHPAQPPAGIEWVFVNGHTVVAPDAKGVACSTGARPGRLLRFAP